MSAKISLDDLKDDIFYEIFTIAAALDRPCARLSRDSGAQGVKINLGWIRLSHVCSRWRTILLHDMPALWAEIPCSIPAAASVILSRARDVSLTLNTSVQGSQNAGYNRNYVLKANAVLRNNINRARLVIHRHRVYDPPQSWPHAVHGISLPYLTKLRAYSYRKDLDAAFGTLIIDAPNLRDVAITGPVIFKHPSLRRLSINCPASNARNFLDILVQQPLLEDLSCSFSWDQSEDWARIPTPAGIQTSSIQTLSLNGTLCGIAEFSRLVIPSGARNLEVDVDCQQSDAHWPILIKWLRQLTHTLDVEALIIAFERGGCSFEYCSQDALGLGRGSVPSQSVFLRAPKPAIIGPEEDTYTFFHGLLTLSRPFSLQHFALSSRVSCLCYEPFLRALNAQASSMASVRSLHTAIAADGSETDYTEALEILSLKTVDDGFVFPSVTELRVPLVQWWENWEIRDGHDKTADTLKMRKDRGYPVQRLILSGKWHSEARRIANSDKDTAGLHDISRYVEEIVDKRTFRWLN